MPVLCVVEWVCGKFECVQTNIYLRMAVLFMAAEFPLHLTCTTLFLNEKKAPKLQDDNETK